MIPEQNGRSQQGKLRNCHSHEEPKETHHPDMTWCHVRDPGTKQTERTLGEN